MEPGDAKPLSSLGLRHLSGFTADLSLLCSSTCYRSLHWCPEAQRCMHSSYSWWCHPDRHRHCMSRPAVAVQVNTVSLMFLVKFISALVHNTFHCEYLFMCDTVFGYLVHSLNETWHVGHCVKVLKSKWKKFPGLLQIKTPSVLVIQATTSAFLPKCIGHGKLVVSVFWL